MPQAAIISSVTLLETMGSVDDGARSELLAEMKDGEEFVVASRADKGFFNSLLNRYHHIRAVTTRQFVILEPKWALNKLLSIQVRSIPLTNATSVETNRQQSLGSIRLRSPDGLDESFIIRADERDAIADALRNQLGQQRGE